jgi:hypothetical protein
LLNALLVKLIIMGPFARAAFGEYSSVQMCGLLTSQYGVFRVRFVDGARGLVYLSI